MGEIESEDVLGYWLSPAPTTTEEADERKRFWFGGSADTDRTIRERFADAVARARSGELDAWAATPRGRLALIILLDQFTRNVYRGKPDAFASDGKALELARTGFDRGLFESIGTLERLFAAMPFRHAEDVEAQKRGVALAVHDAVHGEPHLEKLLIVSVDGSRQHLDVIVRFGRFPHRNATLGRESTPAEVEYLAYLKRAGQWL